MQHSLTQSLACLRVPLASLPTNSWLLKGKESRLSVELVFRLHQAMDQRSDVDIDEIECILANLIYKVRACLA